jgi:hypothetical protein
MGFAPLALVGEVALVAVTKTQVINVPMGIAVLVS